MRKTFLFTDIESSTQLVEAHGEVYAKALNEHRRHLRRHCAARGGDEMGTAGDAYFAAFDRAVDAVAAAVEAQRALRAHDWPPGCELRVRMGLHTGEAEIDGGSYVGMAVHTVARVCAAAHGGQIVVTAETAEEAGPEVELRPLGDHRLRGLTDEVGLHQVVDAHLPSEFPPLNVGAPLDGPTAIRRSIRVLLVDDQELVRTGFRMILGAVDGLTIVGEARNGLEAVEQAERLRPDVVLMDIRMPEMNGIEATRQIRAMPDGPRVVILTTFDLDEYVYDALRAGASGFLLKDTEPADVVRAIHVVVAGDSLLAPSITRRLVQEFSGGRGQRDVDPDAAGRLARLTEREVEVLAAIAKGLTNGEISEALFISETTVKSHVRNLMTKLEARDRVQLVLTAYETGVATPGSGKSR